ncbi:uncharacterized protein LOC142363556 isoform X3 [Opisthocomus hoazin]|uniref:uncharacterized protein LOC142363556 isoform X3 n=1 Tax=Opisthocomus hoazin TaxID=30419 RepID=UPI003F53C485
MTFRLDGHDNFLFLGSASFVVDRWESCKNHPVPGAGEPNDWSCGRRGEERRGEKHLKCQSLPAAPRVRAAWPAPCSSFLAASAEQRVAPGGDGRTVRRWINGRSCGKECRGVGGAEGASGAPSPGAERLPGLAGWGTAKRPELRKRNGAEQDREASEAAESPGSAESESCGAGEPNDWSCGRRGEERRGEKHLKCQSLPAAPRVRAEWPAPCSSFLAASAEQRVAPGGDGRTVRRWINGRSCGKECRGVGGAEGASGAPSPGAERLPGLAGWGTAKRPELRKRNGGEQDGEASEAAESPGSAESESCGAGEPNDWSCGRRGEERRGEKHLKCQSLPAAPRVRAAWPAPCSSFLAASAEQRIAPGGDGRTVRRWINGRSCGKECRGVGGAEGASGAPSPGAERLPGLAGWGTAKRPELRKRNGGEQDGEASEAAESPGSAESESCGAGEPNDWSCGRRGEERRGEKHLKCQSLPAAPRVRAVWPAPCSSFLAASAEQRIAPGGDGRTVRRWSNGRSCGKECRGVGGAEGASGAPSPGAERLPGLAGCVTE